MDSKELCNKVREVCAHLDKLPWNKAGIYKDPPVFPVIPITIELYDEIKSDPNHPLSEYLKSNNENTM